MVEGQVFATSLAGGSGAIVRGVRAEDLLTRPIFQKGYRGDPADFRGEDAVVLGYRLAKHARSTDDKYEFV